MAPVEQVRFPGLRKSRWFTELSPRVQSAIDAHVRLIRVRQDTAVYRQGDEPDGLYMALEGVIQLTSYAARGTGHLQLLAKCGDWFGEASAIDAEPRQQDAISRDEGLVLHFAQADIERIGADHPDLWRAIGRLSTYTQRMAFDYFETIVGLDAMGRIVTMLKALDAHTPGGTLRLSHEQIANSTGVSRQTATKILGRLERDGVIALGYRSIRIL